MSGIDELEPEERASLSPLTRIKSGLSASTKNEPKSRYSGLVGPEVHAQSQQMVDDWSARRAAFYEANPHLSPQQFGPRE